jgi:hypothetical protein
MLLAASFQHFHADDGADHPSTETLGDEKTPFGGSHHGLGPIESLLNQYDGA